LLPCVAHVTWTAHVSWLLPCPVAEQVAAEKRRARPAVQTRTTSPRSLSGRERREALRGVPAALLDARSKLFGDQNRPGGDGADFRIDTNNLIAGGPSGYDIEWPRSRSSTTCSATPEAVPARVSTG
jgi:hypothetical protein